MSDSAQPTTPPAGGRRRKLVIGLVAVLVLAVVATLATRPFASSGSAEAKVEDQDPYALTFDGEGFSGQDAKKPAPQTTPVAQRDSEEKYASVCVSCAKKHKVAEMPAASMTTQVADGARSDEEISKALKKQHLNRKSAGGDKVELAADDSALAPIGAPAEVQYVVAAGNAIRNYPYIWGGGHGSFQASGYDCSGSVSYALKGAGLIDEPLVSGDFERWGEPGPGKWITVYANAGHVFMIVGGLRFDTSFRDGPYGSRWQNAERPMKGFVVRHPTGL